MNGQASLALSSALALKMGATVRFFGTGVGMDGGCTTKIVWEDTMVATCSQRAALTET